MGAGGVWAGSWGGLRAGGVGSRCGRGESRSSFRRYRRAQGERTMRGRGSIWGGVTLTPVSSTGQAFDPLPGEERESPSPRIKYGAGSSGGLRAGSGLCRRGRGRVTLTLDPLPEGEGVSTASKRGPGSHPHLNPLPEGEEVRKGEGVSHPHLDPLPARRG